MTDEDYDRTIFDEYSYEEKHLKANSRVEYLIAGEAFFSFFGQLDRNNIKSIKIMDKEHRMIKILDFQTFQTAISQCYSNLELTNLLRRRYEEKDDLENFSEILDQYLS